MVRLPARQQENLHCAMRDPIDKSRNHLHFFEFRKTRVSSDVHSNQSLVRLFRLMVMQYISLWTNGTELGTGMSLMSESADAVCHGRAG